MTDKTAIIRLDLGIPAGSTYCAFEDKICRCYRRSFGPACDLGYDLHPGPYGVERHADCLAAEQSEIIVSVSPGITGKGSLVPPTAGELMWAEVAEQRVTATPPIDPAKLELLADWLDAKHPEYGSGEVQDDLRKWAAWIRKGNDE